MAKIFLKMINCFSVLLFVASCARPMPIKLRPDYTGVDPKVQNIVNEYVWLGSQNHLTFSGKVTVGLTKINYKTVIGVCTITPLWREIDLDQDFWNTSTKTSHLALLLHELDHCYCGRVHDYADGKIYPETSEKRLKEFMDWLAGTSTSAPPGYLEDGCPSTLMYPEILNDECTLAHYAYYVRELFERCDPW